MSQLFPSGGQGIGASASASVLPMNIQGWFPLGLTGLISLLSRGLSRVFSSTMVRKHQSFGTQPFLLSSSLRSHGLQHTRLPGPSLSPRICSNSCPVSQWCYPTISSSVAPFSSWLLSFPELGSFPISQLFASCGQNIGASASASVLPMNIQNWFPLGWTGWISLQSKGLSRVFSSTMV